MSYCVQCGVKLEDSLSKCPLCNTTVMNPNASSMESATPPFASKQGEVEPMVHTDLGIWLSIVFGSTAIACFFLNLLVFNHNRWSIPVIGACVMLWILFCPRMFNPKIPFVLTLLVSGMSVIFYEYALTFLIGSERWFFELAFPITLWFLVLISIMGILYKFVSRSMLATVLYFFIVVGIYSVVIEIYVDAFIGAPLRLFWSAIVFSVCAVISVAIFSVLSIARLRENVRKRLHF